MALRASAGRSSGSRYESVDKYTRPGNPCPKVPGIGDTVSVFSGGGPKSPVKYWKQADTSAATVFKRARDRAAHVLNDGRPLFMRRNARTDWDDTGKAVVLGGGWSADRDCVSEDVHGQAARGDRVFW